MTFSTRRRCECAVTTAAIGEVGQYGLRRLLEEFGEVPHAGEYSTQVVWCAYIPQEGEAKRSLGIPTVRNLVMQMAVRVLLEPIYKAGFGPQPYGVSPRRSAQQALAPASKPGNQGGSHVLDADIENYFCSIEDEELFTFVSQRSSGRHMLKRAGISPVSLVWEIGMNGWNGGVGSEPSLGSLSTNV
jgi:RNA-directed DNA polymerase